MGLLHRFRQEEALVDVIVFSRVVEVLLRPHALHAGHPFVCHDVALVMFELFDAEHFHLRLEPAANNVDT